MAIEAVIFDLYGTLVDIWTDETDLSVYYTLCRFLNYYGVSFEPEELAARYQESAALHLLDHPGPYGEIDVFLVFEEILQEGLRKTPERTLVICLGRLFRALTTRRLGLFPDTLPALEELAPIYRLGLVSDAQWVFSEPEIRFLGLERYLETVVLSSRYFIRKPAPQIYAHALRAMKLQPSQAVYVGNDAAKDVPGPQAIGMPVALIQREGPPPRIGVPVIKDLREIPSLIQSNFRD
jgi:putative hydrolase of the HAD superfamily|uniref:HAD family hydrolase n=1 Tax=Desulfobacca acetoxidans TaxID=60893 RepID=A0A7C3V7N6_9BACT